MEQDDNKYMRNYILRFLGRIVAGMLLIWNIAYWTDVYNQSKIPPRDKKPYWTNLDPTKSAVDIKSFDCETRTVTYYEHLKPGEEPPKSIFDNPIFKNNGLSDEEIFERLNLEYEDLYEIYMD